MKDREKMLKKVQIADFELIEANLYLDAYPYCQKALEYFYTAKDRADYLRKEYEEKFGNPIGDDFPTSLKSSVKYLELNGDRLKIKDEYLFVQNSILVPFMQELDV